MRDGGDKKIVTAEQAISEVGTLGCFQCTTGAVLVLCYILNGLLIYPLSYLNDKDVISAECL